MYIYIHIYIYKHNVYIYIYVYIYVLSLSIKVLKACTENIENSTDEELLQRGVLRSGMIGDWQLGFGVPKLHEAGSNSFQVRLDVGGRRLSTF